MKQVIKKSIEELNELLPKEKKITMKNTTPLVGEKSKLESIDLVNLFVLVEKGKLPLPPQCPRSRETPAAPGF